MRWRKRRQTPDLAVVARGARTRCCSAVGRLTLGGSHGYSSRQPTSAPRETALGSLVHYITHAEGKRFDPANITFDLLVPLEEETRRKIRDKRERHRIQCERALAAFDAWWAAQAK